MKKLYLLFFTIGTLLSLLSSCTLEKRHYRPGFYCNQHDHYEHQYKKPLTLQPVKAEAVFKPEKRLTDSFLRQSSLKKPEFENRQFNRKAFSLSSHKIFLSKNFPIVGSSCHKIRQFPGSDNDDDEKNPKAKSWTTIGFLLSLLGIIISIAVFIAILELGVLLWTIAFILLAIIFGVLAIVTRGDDKEKAEDENKQEENNETKKPARKRNVPLGVLIWGMLFFVLGLMNFFVAGLFLIIGAGILPLLIVGIIRLVKNKKAGGKHVETRRLLIGMLLGLIGLGIGILLNQSSLD